MNWWTDLKIFLSSRKSAPVLLAVVAIVGLIIFNYFNQKARESSPGEVIRPPKKAPIVKIVRVEPLPDQKDVSTSPTIKISFEKIIKEKKISVATTPQFSFSSEVSPGGYYLSLVPKESLKESTKYRLDVYFEKIKTYSWSFTTGEKGADPQVLEKIKDKLPYQGKHFRVSYASSTDKFFITIDAKPISTYKQAALDWFASQGLPSAEEEINIVYFPVGAAVD